MCASTAPTAPPDGPGPAQAAPPPKPQPSPRDSCSTHTTTPATEPQANGARPAGPRPLQSPGLAQLLRLARDGQGSERGRAKGRARHQRGRRTGNGAAAPFRSDCEEVERVDRWLESPPLSAVATG